MSWELRTYSPVIPNSPLLMRVTDFLFQVKYCELHYQVKGLNYNTEIPLLISICFGKNTLFPFSRTFKVSAKS